MQNYIFNGLIGLLILGACSQEHYQKITTQNGVKLISNSATPAKESAKIPSYELVESLSIGIDEGDTNYVFAQPTAADIDSHGNIYVLDTGFHRISKFDSTGHFLLDFGRKGEGPGEFMYAYEMHINQANEIIIFDANTHRLTIFNPQGKILGDLLTHSYCNFRNNSKNEFVVFSGHTDYANKRVTYSFKQYTQEGIVKDSLFQIDQEVFAVMIGNAAGAVSIKPFDVVLDRADNIYILSDDLYRIDKYAPNGKLMFQFGREYEPVAMNQEEKKNYSQGSVTLNGKRFKPEPPDFKWDISSIFTMPHDEMWAFTSTKNAEAHQLIDVFDGAGKYLRKFHLKHDLPTGQFHFKYGKWIAITRSEDEYPRVKVYGMRKRT